MNHTEIQSAQAAYARQQMMGGVVDQITQFYRGQARLMIDHPDCLNISVETGSDGSLALFVKPHRDDASKLIGAKGAMFHSFRSVLLQLAARNKIRLHYRLETPRPNGLRKPEPEFQSRPDWPREMMMAEFQRACTALFELPHWLLATETEDKTRLQLDLHPDEPVHLPDAELQDGLSKVWHAGGRTNGRIIFLDRLHRRATA